MDYRNSYVSSKNKKKEEEEILSYAASQQIKQSGQLRHATETERNTPWVLQLKLLV